ncbi:MAG: aspartate 1-decarboxylase [Armatimonadota bacterium]
MLRHMAKSKIHGATVTNAVLYYEGSITIDRELMDAADLVPFERVQVVNINNGSRIETYVIEGEPGCGTICLNGPAARHAVVGDKVHVISYAMYEDAEARALDLKNVKVDADNRLCGID